MVEEKTPLKIKPGEAINVKDTVTITGPERSKLKENLWERTKYHPLFYVVISTIVALVIGLLYFFTTESRIIQTKYELRWEMGKNKHSIEKEIVSLKSEIGKEINNLAFNFESKLLEFKYSLLDRIKEATAKNENKESLETRKEQ